MPLQLLVDRHCQVVQSIQPFRELMKGLVAEMPKLCQASGFQFRAMVKQSQHRFAEHHLGIVKYQYFQEVPVQFSLALAELMITDLLAVELLLHIRGTRSQALTISY